MADLENLPYARRYRPNTIAKYIGNEKLKRTVLNTLERGKRPQVVLLYGDSGCGKTTLARLLGKEYSCLDRNDETGACGVCMNCQTIDEYIATGDTGMLANIQEIDITDQSGKKDLDDVFEDMALPAFGDEWKIYIFDEVHMATPALQNRLLKIAEEPPENVLMILCTTDPEKLIETLKNRCQLQLHVTKPELKELAGLLKYVCETEQVGYDRQGLEFIANRGELTIRTALNNLQQVVNEKGGATYEYAIDVFDGVEGRVMIDVFKALKSKDVLRYVTLIADIKAKMDLNSFLTEMKNFVVRGVYTLNGVQLASVSDSEMVVFRDLFSDLSVVEIGYLLNKLLTIDSRNVEVELLTLGYTGLDCSKLNSGNENDIIIPLVNETRQEQINTQRVLKEREKDEYNKGVENSKSFSDTASLDILLSMGASLVEE